MMSLVAPIRLGWKSVAVPAGPWEVIPARAHHSHVRALLVLMVEERHREQSADNKHGVEQRVEERKFEVAAQGVRDNFPIAAIDFRGRDWGKRLLW